MKGKRSLWMFGAFVPLVAACLVVALNGCRKEEVGELPTITGKNVVMVIAKKNFQDKELFEPKEIIEKAGGEVTVASSSLKEAKGMLGKTFKPDILLENVKADEFDAVVFVGGTGASEYWNDSKAHFVAKSAVEKGKLVCAICIAPVTLANAGLLEGKKATVWKSEAGKIKKQGATYTGAKVQIDGKFITANGPKSAAKFGEAIVRALGG